MPAFPERAGDASDAGSPVHRLVEEGLARYAAKDPRGAMAAFLAAHAAAPREPRPLVCIAGLHGVALQHERALAFFREAIACAPARVRTWTGYGYALIAAGQDGEALEAFAEARRLAPAMARPLVGVGEALGNLGRPAEALAAFVRAQALEPGHATASFLESLTRLQLGDLGGGFERYESRFQVDPPRYEAIDWTRLWTNEPLQGMRLLIASEQGFGDLFQFLRCVATLHTRGAVTIVEAREPTLPLLRELSYVSACFAKGDTPPPYDRVVPLMSLAHRLGVTARTTLWTGPYIPAPPRARAGRLRVGVAWRGSPTNAMDARRSLPVEALAPVLSVQGVEFICLQMEPTPAEVGVLLQHGVREAVASGADFRGTRDAIATLDLVISVDTSIVHLTGAMGRPVWPMLCFSPDWRWQLERADSPWYPSARLFRQPAYGAWGPVIEAVAAALHEEAARTA